MTSQQIAAPEASRNSVEATDEHTVSTNSRDETPSDAPVNRVDEVVAAEKQQEDGTVIAKKPLSGIKFLILATALTLTGVIILMDMTVLVTVRSMQVNISVLQNTYTHIRQSLRLPPSSILLTISVGTPMLIRLQCEFQTNSVMMVKLISIRAVLLPLAGKLTSHFNSKVCS
jgi:hypothetical protein